MFHYKYTVWFVLILRVHATNVKQINCFSADMNKCHNTHLVRSWLLGLFETKTRNC